MLKTESEEVAGAYCFQVVHVCVFPFVTFFDACLILLIVHARVLKFHIWIPHGKIAEPYLFFLSELSPFLELCSLEEIRLKSYQQEISKSIWARGLKLCQLIEDDE